MVVPPSYAKGVSVKNTTPHRVQVTVWFGSDEQEADGHDKICETRELTPNEVVKLDEHTYDMGTWTAVAALHSLDVEAVGHEGDAGALLKAHFKPEVSGIVPVLHVEVKTHPSNDKALHVTPV